MAARDPRNTAANLLLGFAGGAAGLAAAVSATTGHQGPFAAAGLAGLAAGAGLASRVLAVDVVEDARADVEMKLADAYTDLEIARLDLDVERGRNSAWTVADEREWV